MKSDMSGSGSVESNQGIYWGWVVVMGAFLMLCFNYGARYSFGVFVKPMFLEYQWSLSIISLGATVNMLVYASSSYFTGQLLDRMAPKWIMTIGVVLAALGFILMAFAQKPSHLFLFFGVLCGLGSSGFGVVLNSASVGKWFLEKKGLALGIAVMGIGFGTMLMTPLAGWAVKNFDWRVGFISVGVFILTGGVLVSQLCMGKSNPEAYGLLPDGKGVNPDLHAHANVGTVAETVSSTSIFKNSRFWVLVISFSTACIAPMMMIVHLVPYAISCNIEKITAASSLGIIGVASILGRLFHGLLSDRLHDPKYSAVLGFLIMAAGMFIMMNIATTAGTLYLYAVIFGFGYGSIAPLMPAILSDRFGRRVLGTSYGALTFFVASIASLGPLLGGLIYDNSGSYTFAWRLNCALLISAALLLLFLKPNDTAK